jgi:hypothetical protein
MEVDLEQGRGDYEYVRSLLTGGGVCLSGAVAVMIGLSGLAEWLQTIQL